MNCMPSSLYKPVILRQLLKANLFEEGQNLALISALLLTVFVQPVAQCVPLTKLCLNKQAGWRIL